MQKKKKHFLRDLESQTTSDAYRLKTAKRGSAVYKNQLTKFVI